MPPPQLFLPDWFADQICLVGQGKKTCIYLTVGENGFTCAKLIPNASKAINERRKTFTAQGDNCPGTPMINPSTIRGN